MSLCFELYEFVTRRIYYAMDGASAVALGAVVPSASSRRSAQCASWPLS